MSWDISMYTHIDGETVFFAEVGNYTYNVFKMYATHPFFKKGINSLSDTQNKKLIQPLTELYEDMEKRPEFFKKMNPSNGWGNYEGAKDYIKTWLDLCIKYPSAYTYVC